RQVITGAFDEWTYEHRGVFSWTVEFWNPMKQAGIENAKYIEWYREHPIEDDLKLLQWNDKALKGKGFVDWYPFDHPQIGRIELGGWDFLHMWTNVPLEFLENEIRPFPEWIVWHALISPKLGLREASVTPLGRDSFRVRFVVQNEGWLPTYVTHKALEKKVTRGVIAEIILPDGASLESGKAREELKELEGRALKNSFVDELAEGTSDLVKVDWVVKAKKGTKIQLLAKHERAGLVRVEIVLK
ncbi:MAG TPA: hypothetical protein VGK56_20335, partial [Anaerolineales bacterium]